MTSVNMFTQFSGARVFVTGHSGFKGAWLCAFLRQLGAEVFGYSIDEPEDERHIYHALGIRSQLRNTDQSVGDVGDFYRLSAALDAAKPDYLFHLAAQPIVSTSYLNPHRTFMSNTMGVLNVLEYVRGNTRKMTSVIITSDKCYKNVERQLPYVESDELGGNNPYSASKAAAELAFHSYVRSFPFFGGTGGIATARAGNVFGGGDWSRDRLIPDCARDVLAGKDIEIRMPAAIRPWTFVVDILSGYLQLAGRLALEPSHFRGSWNFASGETKTVLEVVQAFIRAIGHGNVVVNSDRTIGKEASLLLIDPTKANTDLGWRATFTVGEALKHTADWYRLQSEGFDMARHTRTFLNRWYLDGERP